MLRRLFVLTLFLSTQAFAQPTQGGAIPVPLPLFPANNWWNSDISGAPVDPNSASYIAFINNGGTRHVHPDWGGDVGDGTVYGLPYIIVDGSQTKLTVQFGASPDESDGVDHNNGDTSFPAGGERAAHDRRTHRRHIYGHERERNLTEDTASAGASHRARSGAYGARSDSARLHRFDADRRIDAHQSGPLSGNPKRIEVRATERRCGGR